MTFQSIWNNENNIDFHLATTTVHEIIYQWTDRDWSMQSLMSKHEIICNVDTSF